ncbi:MAG: hypothetical protein H6617_02635 [Bdellovibrionaceae bacterium]|nr:hypothetical protein [Bdellovibrionales bacterium]MCB9253559.1 hypothetical protein [Pseudobdellovibrionaceae bacterium]
MHWALNAPSAFFVKVFKQGLFGNFSSHRTKARVNTRWSCSVHCLVQLVTTGSKQLTEMSSIVVGNIICFYHIASLQPSIMPAD